MAKKEIAFDVTISAADAVKELDAIDKGAKKAGESLKAVGDQSAKGISVAEQNIKKLDDSFKKLNPEQKAESIKKVAEGVVGGFQAVQGAFALLGKNAEAIEIAFQKAQSAFLVADGIKKVTEGVGKLGDVFGTLKGIISANPLTAVLGIAITGLVAGFIALGGATNKYTEAINDNNEAIDKQIELNRQRASVVEKGLTQEIALARASGKEVFELEKKKLEATINRVEQEIILLRKKRDFEKAQLKEQADEYLASGPVFAIIGKKINEQLIKQESDKNKEINKLGGELQDAKNLLAVNEVAEDKKNNDKILAQAKELNNDKLKLAKSEEEKRREAEKQELFEINKFGKEAVDLLPQIALPAMQTFQEEMFTSFELLNAAIKRSVDDLAEFLNGKFGTIQDFSVQTVQQNLNTVSGFFDAAQNNQLAAAEGNEKAQEAIRKKFFEKQKKLQIAQGLISTFEGGIQAFKSTAASPITVLFPAAPYIAAGSAIAAGLANVAKIRSQSFEGGGGGSATTGNAPNLGNLNTQNPFQVNNQLLNPSDIEAGNTTIPQQKDIKVFVPATDISDALKKNESINNNAEVS